MNTVLEVGLQMGLKKWNFANPELNKLVAASLSGLDVGKYADGSGLWLHKRSRVAGKWLFLHKSGGRRR